MGDVVKARIEWTLKKVMRVDTLDVNDIMNHEKFDVQYVARSLLQIFAAVDPEDRYMGETGKCSPQETIVIYAAEAPTLFQQAVESYGANNEFTDVVAEILKDASQRLSGTASLNVHGVLARNYLSLGDQWNGIIDIAVKRHFSVLIGKVSATEAAVNMMEGWAHTTKWHFFIQFFREARKVNYDESSQDETWTNILNVFKIKFVLTWTVLITAFQSARHLKARSELEVKVAAASTPEHWTAIFSDEAMDSELLAKCMRKLTGITSPTIPDLAVAVLPQLPPDNLCSYTVLCAKKTIVLCSYEHYSLLSGPKYATADPFMKIVKDNTIRKLEAEDLDIIKEMNQSEVLELYKTYEEMSSTSKAAKEALNHLGLLTLCARSNTVAKFKAKMSTKFPDYQADLTTKIGRSVESAIAKRVIYWERDNIDFIEELDLGNDNQRQTLIDNLQMMIVKEKFPSVKQFIARLRKGKGDADSDLEDCEEDDDDGDDNIKPQKSRKRSSVAGRFSMGSTASATNSNLNTNRASFPGAGGNFFGTKSSGSGKRVSGRQPKPNLLSTPTKDHDDDILDEDI